MEQGIDLFNSKIGLYIIFQALVVPGFAMNSVHTCRISFITRPYHAESDSSRCSSAPLFPRAAIPPHRCFQWRCSPVPLLPRTAVPPYCCFPVSLFPRVTVPPHRCSPVPCCCSPVRLFPRPLFPRGAIPPYRVECS
ncbi:hypothetical protein ACOMHN_038609 [Nucella lapillus]